MDEPAFPEDFNMADWFLAAGAPDKTAILFEGRTITYAEVRDKVEHVARRLITEGLLPEQRVLVCMRDCPEFVYAWFGAIKAGAVVTQVNPLLPYTDYAYYLDYVKPQFAFVDDASAEAFGAAAKRSRHGRGVIGNFESWLSGPISPDAEPWPTRRDDPAVWLFTSGSTGKSKAAVHSHGHFPFNTEVYAKRFIGMHPDDVTISGARLYFGYATGTNLMFPFAAGATTILFREQPSAELLFDLIERHRPTVFTSVPTLIHRMLESDRRGDLSSLRFMWSAGEALPRELHDRWDEAFGVPIVDGIGSAESFHIYISNHPDDIRPGSLGRLVPGYEAKLLDDDGQQVTQGDVGTLWLKGASAALCYHADYAKSVEHLRGGWIVSGDKFRQDAEGYWYYEGRGDDLIKSGGIYVSPIEVENVLAQHAAVGECCVLGQRDEAGLEKPVAIVLPRAGAEASAALEAELIAFARERLVHYKAPRAVLFADAPLPRNDRDKLDRKTLKIRFG
ncbi:benzoate-CoA ligase family protein [Sphingomonas tabacisoli]|uniref:Benzoate-CoA ligase family protein n=1 Tax=Sphingomonas tabacisoli TaxID=2249466 RepID=A0ABW4I0Y0_9SPHN